MVFYLLIHSHIWDAWLTLTKVIEHRREARCRIKKSSRCFFGLRHNLRSKLLTRATKIMLYKTLVWQVLAFGEETWTVTKSDKFAIQVLERRIHRTIYNWVVKDGLYPEPEISRFIHLCRLRWAGQVARMDRQRFSRRKGRPNWCDTLCTYPCLSPAVGRNPCKKEWVVVPLMMMTTLTAKQLAVIPGILKNKYPGLLAYFDLHARFVSTSRNQYRSMESSLRKQRLTKGCK